MFCGLEGEVKRLQSRELLFNRHLNMTLDCLVRLSEIVHRAICYILSALVSAVVSICLVHKEQGVWPYKWCGFKCLVW